MDEYEPTMQLRWAIPPPLCGAPVLQQRWVLRIEFLDPDLPPEVWRDVPRVLE